MKNIALLYLIGKKDKNRNRFYKNATNYVSDISDVGLPKRNILMKLETEICSAQFYIIFLKLDANNQTMLSEMHKIGVSVCHSNVK